VRDTEVPGGLPRWVWLGLALRLALVGFHHPWDLQTFYNMFADLSHGTWPYETFRILSGVARALTSLTGVREPAYEYYAYPPLLALLYWPLARIVASVTPLAYALTMPGALALRAYPWTFLVAFKLPLWLSDLAIALVLRRLAGERAARLFFLNPLLVVVSGSWTVDTLMALPSLLSVALVLRGRYAWGGVLLAVGALVKWMPVVLWPAVALWLVYTGVEGRRQAAFHAAFWVTLGVGLLPGWPGVLEVARFHAERPGAHLTPHVLLYVLQTWRGRPDAELVRLSAAVGSVTLPAALLLAYVVQYRRRLPLVAACCLSLTAFYLGSKIVNEPYLFLWVSLLLWELSERPDARKEFVMRAGYGAALAFATVNVPIVLFAAPVVLAVLPESPYPEVVFRDASRALWPWREQALILASLAFFFVGILGYGFWVLAQEGGDGASPREARGSGFGPARSSRPCVSGLADSGEPQAGGGGAHAGAAAGRAGPAGPVHAERRDEPACDPGPGRRGPGGVQRVELRGGGGRDAA
jgi:hypothetical protein